MGLAILYVTICYLCFLGGIFFEKYYLSKKELQNKYEAEEFPEFDYTPEAPENFIGLDGSDEDYQTLMQINFYAKKLRHCRFRIGKGFSSLNLPKSFDVDFMDNFYKVMLAYHNEAEILKEKILQLKKDNPEAWERMHRNRGLNYSLVKPYHL